MFTESTNYMVPVHEMNESRRAQRMRYRCDILDFPNISKYHFVYKDRCVQAMLLVFLKDLAVLATGSLEHMSIYPPLLLFTRKLPYSLVLVSSLTSPSTCDMLSRESDGRSQNPKCPV